MVYRALTKIIQLMVLISGTVMTALVIIEVFLRYLFGRSLYVTEELSRYLMVWVVFLGSSLALREGAHIKIGLLVNKFGGRVRICLHLIAHLLLLLFLVVLVIQGIIVLPFQKYQIAPSIGVSFYWFYLAIPVGGILMILYLMPQIGQSIKEMFSKDDG